MSFVKYFLFFSCAALICACTATISPDDEDEISSVSSSSGKKSSSSKTSDKKSSAVEKDKSSSSGELDEDCVGEPGIPWDGTTAKDFACGAGTKLSPYIILTAEQLAKLSFIVGANDKNYQGKYYKLGADILLNDGKIIDDKGALVADSSKLHKWTPIGNSSVTFTGTFDGDGHTVSGMFINTTSSHNGLFGNSSGTIQNLTVENSWVSGGNATAGVLGILKGAGSLKNITNKATVVGNGNVTGGVMAGIETVCCNKIGNVEYAENYGSVTGVKTAGGVAGSVQDIVITNAINNADISGTQGVGGIAGSLGYNSSLTNAVNKGPITGKEQPAGIAGYFGYWVTCSAEKRASMKNAINYGNINGQLYTAGIVGKNDCTKSFSLANKSKIVGTKYVAGIFGYIKNSTITSAYNLGDVYGDIYIGGTAGYNEVGVSQSVYSTGKVDGDSLVGLMIGYNYNTTMADYYYLEQGDQEPFGLNNGGGVATPKTAKEMKSSDFAELLGEDFIYDSGLNDGYPVLKWEKEE
ncbi:hypothetical protein [Fibrobacter sp.]|uniref:hypothetical protein n=1 Tax=Fibrobacter sp. TaxID=35828 RepID=UPI00262BA28F|nr:hypothetical protein [Fibrobacter sp.]MDD5941187.1 hypothetical protein [Fibrobacter sp.]